MTAIGESVVQPSVKYVGRLEGVRELGLAGTADASWWRERLTDEELEPLEADGRAEVVVTGLDAKWTVFPFRDISVVVFVRDPSGTERPALFLPRAFNASRFIAASERWFFRTPYEFRPDLHVDLGSPAAVRIGGASAPELLAELGPREASDQAKAPSEQGYTGPLFVPGGGGRVRRRWFQVRIQGLTTSFAFDPARDRFEIGTGCTDAVFSGLRESGFEGRQWHLRRDASHARSKTFQERR